MKSCEVHCKNCGHSEKGHGNCVYYQNCYVLSIGDRLGAICKHYAEPEPSAFEKWWNVVCGDGDSEQPWVDDKAAANAGWDAGYKQRGEDDVEVMNKTHYVNSANELTIYMAQEAIRKLDEGED